MITPRLQGIIELTDGETIADIGTDHAYIPIKLAMDKKIKKAIACDKNTGPLKIAEDNVKKYQLSDIIDLRCGGGLEPIEKGEAECIIIAGMGGNLIGDIIEENHEKAAASRLILQPMNAQYELRSRLIDMGFTIEKEELSSEGHKVYNMMRVVFGRCKKPDNPIYLHLPPELFSHRLFAMLADKKEREFKKIITGQKNSAVPDKQIIESFEKLLKELNKIRNNNI